MLTTNTLEKHNFKLKLLRFINIIDRTKLDNYCILASIVLINIC